MRNIVVSDKITKINAKYEKNDRSYEPKVEINKNTPADISDMNNKSAMRRTNNSVRNNKNTTEVETVKGTKVFDKNQQTLRLQESNREYGFTWVEWNRTQRKTKSENI